MLLCVFVCNLESPPNSLTVFTVLEVISIVYVYYLIQWRTNIQGAPTGGHRAGSVC